MLRRLALTFIALSSLAVTSITWAAEPEVAVVEQPAAVVEQPVVVKKPLVVAVKPLKTDWVYPLVIAAGAVAGVAATNAFTYSVGTIPYWIGITTAAPIVSPAAAAASRIFVITSGVLGAWITDAVYTTATH